MKTRLGALDPYADETSWSAETAEFWIHALEARSASPDQFRMREFVIHNAGLTQGAVAVEIGCGVGALICDLARAVPGGRVIGVEPQPALGLVARRKKTANAQCSCVVLEASAEDLPLQANTVHLCIEQTVLIHLPKSTAMQGLQEMFRVVRPRRCVMSVDHDADTWAIDHSDRDLTRAIVRFNSDQRFADGWRGRQLRSMFLEVGLVDVETHPWVHVDTGRESYLFVLAERISNAAVDGAFISNKERDGWMRELPKQADRGRFFSSMNFNICRGTKPLNERANSAQL
jgi:SAM-dependent methyltransferase